MKEFLIAIHRDLTGKSPMPSPEQMKEAMKPYQEWIAGIAAADKLVAPPKRWDVDGRVITGRRCAGRSLCREKEIDWRFIPHKGKGLRRGSRNCKKKCPIIQYGAIVEVRMAIPAA